MSENINTFPVIPLRGLAILPGTTVHFDVSRKSSIAAAEEAMLNSRELFVVAQKDPVEETPGFDGVYKVGTIVVVKQLNKLQGNVIRVMVEAVGKGRLQSLYEEREYLEGEAKIISDEENTLSDTQEEAFVRELKDAVKTFHATINELSESSFKGLMAIEELEKLMIQILLRIKVDYKTKQEFLEVNGILDKFSVVLAYLTKESEIGEIRAGIISKVKERLDKSQKEHILREQMQVIREELGDDFLAEADEFEKQIHELNADEEVKEKLLKELSRFKSYAGNAVEGNVIRTYLENMLELPWNNETEENPDLKNAEEILNRDHYELKIVKERILVFLAV